MLFLLSDSRRHRSIPVETDESMTSSTLNLALPLDCGQGSEHRKRPKEEAWFAPEVTVNDVGQVEYPKDSWRNPMGDPLGNLRPQPRAPSLHQKDMSPHTPDPVDLRLHPCRERAQWTEDEDFSLSGLLQRKWRASLVLLAGHDLGTVPLKEQNT